MADDHTHLMGQDVTEMGMKRNMMTRTKNHAHSICMILHTHEVRGGTCLFNRRCTNGVFYSSIKKMQITQGIAWGGANIVYKDISLRAP